MRRFLAVVLGVVIGSITFFVVGLIANAIYPTPPELMDPATPQAVAQRVAYTGTITWLTMVFGLALGAFLGGAFGTVVAREKIVRVTGAIGLVLSIWALFTFYVIFPAVLWVPFGMLISVFLFSYLGGRAVLRSLKIKDAPTN